MGTAKMTDTVPMTSNNDKSPSQLNKTGPDAEPSVNSASQYSVPAKMRYQFTASEKLRLVEGADRGDGQGPTSHTPAVAGRARRRWRGRSS